MKVGMRSPSIKRSVKARTTGRITRAAKSSVNPLYGKKGMGYIKDPEKAVKNAIYHKTTVGIRDNSKSTSSSSGSFGSLSYHETYSDKPEYCVPKERKPILSTWVKMFVLFAVILLVCLYIGARL